MLLEPLDVHPYSYNPDKSHKSHKITYQCLGFQTFSKHKAWWNSCLKDGVISPWVFTAASASASSSAAAASAAGFFFFDFLGIRWRSKQKNFTGIHQTSSTYIHMYRYSWVMLYLIEIIYVYTIIIIINIINIVIFLFHISSLNSYIRWKSSNHSKHSSPSITIHHCYFRFFKRCLLRAWLLFSIGGL